MNEESIKLAFSKVKSDIEVLQNEILSSKQAIQEGKETIESLKSKISELKEILIELKSQFSTGNEGVQSINHSTINQSLAEHSKSFRSRSPNWSFSSKTANNQEEQAKHSEEWTERSEKQTKHSEEWTEHSKDLRNSNQSTMQQAPIRSSTFSKVRELNEALSKTFQSLTNQEFKVFLTIYQLEDERGKATYNDLALKTSLTSGCIRGYVSSLILKGTPIVKTRQKNRQASLTIDNSFRSLGLKGKLINLYYQQDPQQTTLFAVK